MSSEFDLIRRYFARPVQRAVLGVGDDCALLQVRPGLQLAVSTDMLLEGRHFLAGTDPRKLGSKSLAVNLSDLAAAGADPAYALLAIALPRADEEWLAAFSEGFFALASQYRVELVGGDTTRGPLSICVTVIGEVPGGLALRRDGAAAGDDAWISGATGEAALALAHHQGRVRLEGPDLDACLARLDTPTPRIELGGRLRGMAHSAIDVSDGLLADLGHVAEASGLSIDIDFDLLPQAPALRACSDRKLALECMVAGGDDYELAFTAPRSLREELSGVSRELGLALTRIGTAVPGRPGASLRDGSGKPVNVQRRGFDHFA
jgi:thiamine-monophosphate kinase